MEEVLVEKFIEWIREDIPYWDITTDTIIPPDTMIRAAVLSNCKGVAACINDLARIIRSLGLKVNIKKMDGEVIKPNDIIMEINGNAGKILYIERTLLNILMYCCGIATATRKLVNEVRKRKLNILIAATRKILPGLRYFAKKAVIAGGGDPHRLGLSDMVLIKDNHVKIIGSVREAVKKARQHTSFSKKIEVEVNSIDEALEAAEAGADIIMLDNMDPDTIRKALIELDRRGLRDTVLIEVSGGIRPNNIKDYLIPGIDIISTGWITHSAPACDIKLEVLEVIK